MIVDIVDFLGFLFILLAAFSISSNKANISPKLRLFAFSSYLIACFFLIALGFMVGTAWFIAQQIVLVGINIRGIYNSIRDVQDEIDEKCYNS